MKSAYEIVLGKIPEPVQLIAVSKFRTTEEIMALYHLGQRKFAENRVQNLLQRREELPQDIEWHLIGHLQSNKVKQIMPFVHTIHSVDSEKLLQEIQKQAASLSRKVNVLLQIKIAEEESKFGLEKQEAAEIIQKFMQADLYPNVVLVGIMGMGTLTENTQQTRLEFKFLAACFQEFKSQYFGENADFKELCMGMSGDYEIAIEEGATMLRIGSALFA